jgi:hypothetical protein
MDAVCFKNEEMTSSYSPGDCAHGVGHALMFLSGYTVPEAIEACKAFDNTAMKYYCATGAYMEYYVEKDVEDAKTKSLFYPCDTYDYPAACSRYKAAGVAIRHYRAGKTVQEFVQECEKFQGKFRLGCFHGLGNAHMYSIVVGKTDIKDLCLTGTADEQFMCIEGSMERMAKYHKEAALRVCEQFEGRNKETCLTAVDNGMYNMNKNLSLYLAE